MAHSQSILWRGPQKSREWRLRRTARGQPHLRLREGDAHALGSSGPKTRLLAHREPVALLSREQRSLQELRLRCRGPLQASKAPVSSKTLCPSMAPAPGTQLEDERPQAAPDGRCFIRHEDGRPRLNRSLDESVSFEVSKLVEQHFLFRIGEPLELTQTQRPVKKRPEQGDFPPTREQAKGALRTSGR